MRLKNIRTTIIPLCFVMLSVSMNAFSASTTYTSTGTGDWDTGSNWDTDPTAPSSLSGGDIINISAGHTITKTGDLNPNVNNLVFHVWGDLIITGTLDVKNNMEFHIYPGGSVVFGNITAANNTTLIIDGGGTATVTGDFTMGTGTDITLNGDLTVEGDVDIGGGTLVGSGDFFYGTCSDQLCADNNMVPLPVELLFFRAKSEEDQVILTWSTASELNNDFFTLEKSKNGSDFVKLTEVIGNGTTNLQVDYSFTDPSPYLGLSHYRLSQTDYDGTTEVFPVVSVLFEGNKSFSVGPNPVSGSCIKLKISEMGNHELLELNIIDLQGRLVEKKQLKADSFGNVDTEIQLQKPLQKGTYVFELSSTQHKEYVKVAAE